MKYQIIIEHSISVSDDEFRTVVEAWLSSSPLFRKTRLVEARSLDGIIDSAWQMKDDLSDIL